MSDERRPAPASRKGRSFAHRSTIVVLCLGIGLSASAYFVAAESQRKEHVAHLLNDSAAPLALVVGKSLDRHIEAVQAIVGLHAASEVVDRREFQTFAQLGLARHPGIQALEWVPRVAAGERAAYEEQAKLDGYVNFRITERTSEGDLVPAASRGEYFPVYFVEPLRGNERALGFDLGSNPRRLEALTLARDTGHAVATGAVELVQKSGRQKGVLVFVPVYSIGKTPETIEDRRKYLSGFALGVSRVGDMLKAAIGNSAAASAFDIYLIDESAEADERLLHYHPASVRSAPSVPLSEAELASRPVYRASLTVGGRNWTLLFDHAADHFDAHTQGMPLGVAGVGLLLTLILAHYLAGASNRARLVEQLVDERSKALTTTNSALKVENARRQRIEEALRESETRFRGVVENLPVAISLKDLEGRFLLVNSRFQEWYVPPGTDPVGMSSYDFYPEEHAGFFTAQDRAVLDSLESTESEGEVLFQDGRSHWVHSIKFPIFDSEGRPIGVGGINSDATERRQAETALRESQEQFRCVVDNSPDAIFLKDLRGRFRLVNKRFEDWYGIAAEDALGLTAHDVFGQDFADNYVQQDNEVLKTGQTVSRDHEVPFADGTIHPIMVSKFPVFDSEGRPVGVGTVNTDLTEQRQMESQLRQNAKMEALGTLAGGIAHDLNNVMVPILGLTKLAMRRLPEDGRAYGNLEKVLEASNRAKDLIKQILAFSRADKPQREPILIESIVNEVLAFVRSAIPSTIEIRSAIEPGVGNILADSTQIHQVLMNLATNAAHAMGEKSGILEITLARAEVEKELTALGSHLEPGLYARLSVRDTGHGMDETTVQRIFDPFFTTKGVGEGTGMGLAVVHGIVTRHEGSLMVSSRPGLGTTFEIYFPICEADTAESGIPNDCRPDTPEDERHAVAGSGTAAAPAVASQSQ